MNRKQRRQKRDNAPVKTYNMNQRQLQSIIDNEMQEIKSKSINFTISAMQAAFVIALHDEFGFGPQRLERLISKVENQFDCIIEGTVELKDLIQWAEEYGVKIKGGNENA